MAKVGELSVLGFRPGYLFFRLLCRIDKKSAGQNVCGVKRDRVHSFLNLYFCSRLMDPLLDDYVDSLEDLENLGNLSVLDDLDDLGI